MSRGRFRTVSAAMAALLDTLQKKKMKLNV
jgi:hypothetical protein